MASALWQGRGLEFLPRGAGGRLAFAVLAGLLGLKLAVARSALHVVQIG